MAFSFSKSVSTVFGNQRAIGGVVTADAASGVVSFGLSTITHVEWAPKSCTTSGFRVRQNAVAGGTASQGDIGVSGCASGDEFYVTVYGR